ncbi:transporter substrate-binding domain-containing protein [Pollutimonas bauzanensis]|uniref:Amino acid ABC transporter substrate-binding protein, PAAT family n=1 Tax=Pollutimonas bauzanensis TaxID=658167 RepID=A0A1M5NJA4_9BURK|nr:transporter substrate-binding domain-containing protein [Pollutimonas bauzanensis]SHG89601.1 amino acid ABC transporter substrate-binding protein, PAAT family [Pollutimonas bauzanensis]
MSWKKSNLPAAMLAAGIASLSFMHAALADPTLDRIKQRHKIAVGIGLTGEAFGTLDPATQEPIGYQVDLARDLARRLGVDLDIVPVATPNRIQFLQSGKVDLLMSSLVWTEERSRLLGLVPTPYYHTGGVALTRKDSGIHELEDLRGKPVCMSQGSSFARPLTVDYGIVVKGYRTIAESVLALRGGTCVAAVHASSALSPQLSGKDPAWSDYHAPITQIDPSAWVAAARREDSDTIAAVDAVIQEWHRNGFLIATEAKYHIEPKAQALVELHDKYSRAR